MDNIKWTENQKEVFDLEKNKEGKHIVKACPGSGKTTCISERIVRFIEQNEEKQTGLAILSFTNVAINEIKEYYENETGKKIRYPNFIGTIDSFIKNYIFLPYGNIVMKYNGIPKLVGLPYSKWNRTNYYEKSFDKFTYDLNGNIIKVYKNAQLDNAHKQMKLRLTKKGFATQHDANYFSMKVLKEFPNITKSIINRFPYIIIDEAQDMSEIQMEILNILIKNGLKNIFLVGDSNQAIFEWNNAKPTLFEEKCEEWKENLIELNMTHRCSKEISEYLSKLSNNTISSNKSYYPPKIITYKQKNEVIENFLNYCKEKKEISEEKIAILSRSQNHLNNIFTNTTKEIEINTNNILKNEESSYKKMKKPKNSFEYKKVRNYSENIIEGICLYNNNDFFESFKEFEKAYIKIKYNKFEISKETMKKIIKEEGFFNHRKNIYNFIKSLKIDNDLNQLVDAWIKRSNEKIDIYSNFSIENFYITPIKIEHGKQKLKLNKILTWKMLLKNEKNEEKNYYMGTIHSAKGRTFDAVLLLLKENAGNNRKYIKLLNENKFNLNNCEELRILFVGMSRPKYILNIAIPIDEEEGWRRYFQTNTLDSYFN